MVRSVSRVNPNGFNNLLLNSRKTAKKSLQKNTAKHIDLPAKLTLSALGIFGADKVIGDEKADKAFLMRCSDYEGCGDFYCDLMMYGP